jgi:hypothetical protein
MDVPKALAVLAESGIELTDDQANALAEFKSQTMRDEAEKVFVRKLRGDNDKQNAQRAVSWTKKMFDLADDISGAIVGANVGRGRGEVHEQMFRIETPSGSLKVSLTNEPTSE